MRLVLLGAPGAGKGTQAALLKERDKCAHISTGDIFRQNLGLGLLIGTGLGIFVKAVIGIIGKRRKNQEKSRYSKQSVILVTLVLCFAAATMAILTDMNILQTILAVAGVCLACLLS